MKVKFVAAFVASLAIASCGTDQSNIESSVQDISVPGNPSTSNQLMWHDNGVVYFGNCVAGRLPNRENCTAQKNITYNVLLERLRRDFFSDVDSRKVKREIEINNLKSNHPVIVNLNQEINLLTLDINSLNAQKPALQTAKTNITKEVTDLADKITDYDEQIANVNDRLAADPNNTDLLRLKSVLETERSNLVTRKTDAEVRLTKVNSDISELEARVNVKQAEKNLKVAEHTRRWNELQVTSDLLVKLDQELIAIDVEQQLQQRVLNLLLDNNISHRSDLLGPNDRKVIQRISSAVSNTVEYHHSDVFTYLEGTARYGISRLNVASLKVACRSVGRTFKSYETALYQTSISSYTFNCKGDEKNLHHCSKSAAGGVRDTYKIICE